MYLNLKIPCEYLFCDFLFMQFSLFYKEMDSGYNLKLKVRMEKQVKANYKYRKSLKEDKKW